MIIKNYKFFIKASSKINLLTYPLFSFTRQKLKVDADGLYYQKLGVPENAQLHQLKRRYYELSKKFHPDIYKGDLTQFHSIKEAYQILTNEELRNQYDRLIQKANKAKQQKQTKSEQQEQQQSGPYQTEQEYEKYSKGYYNMNSLQWNNKRRGIRQQSFISSESFMYRNMGATNDDEITHYDRKLLFEKKRQAEEDNIKNQEQQIKIRVLSQQLKEKHKDRINTAMQDYRKKRREALKQSWIGSLIVRAIDKFSNRKYEKDA